MTKIELDYKRIEDYQKLSNNLIAVEEYFRHGDILLREVNGLLQEVKTLIDTESETSFVKQDFDDMLNMRNTILAPIFQNASFAVQFTPYSSGEIVIPPVVEVPQPINTTNNRIIDGTLVNTTIITTLSDKVIKVVSTNYSDNVVNDTNTIEYLEDSVKSTKVKYSGNILIYYVETITNNNIVETTVTNLDNGIPISYTYTKYENGILIENTTTTI